MHILYTKVQMKVMGWTNCFLIYLYLNAYSDTVHCCNKLPSAICFSFRQTFEDS